MTSNRAKTDIEILGFGDTGPYFEPVHDYLKYVEPLLVAADIRIAQCERVYTRLGERQVTGSDSTRLSPEKAAVFSDCQIDVVSLAGNQAMDFGAEALLDTKRFFQGRGIQVVGVGRNLEEAREPVIVECKGKRVAVLAYCSVLKKGYDAGPNRAGVAPLRVRTFYEAMWDWEPGSPGVVHTIPYEEDLEALCDDVASARQSSDFVALMIHWGIHFIPRTIADYQPKVAEAAFAAGADVIFGHHAHVPKAVAVHGGKVCFYSLSNFVISQPAHSPEYYKQLEPFGVFMDPGYPNLQGRDGKRSLIARVLLKEDGGYRVSFVPVLIDKELRPEPLGRGDPRFDEALEYMEWVADGFNHLFAVADNEVVVMDDSSQNQRQGKARDATSMA
jgi:hypothetical protein